MHIDKIEIHGHEVLEMMTATGQPYSKESLKAAIDTKFGSATSFCICSGGGMDAETLIETLWAKGKFAGTPDSFIFDIGTRCDL